MSLYRSCSHNAYHSHLRGVWLTVPCWVADCPGATPHDSPTSDKSGGAA